MAVACARLTTQTSVWGGRAPLVRDQLNVFAKDGLLHDSNTLSWRLGTRARSVFGGQHPQRAGRHFEGCGQHDHCEPAALHDGRLRGRRRATRQA